MTDAMVIHIEEKGERLILEFDYHQRFIEWIKTTISYKDRIYNDKTKVWIVNKSYANEIKEIVPELFDEAFFTYVDGKDTVEVNLLTGQTTRQGSLL